MKKYLIMLFFSLLISCDEEKKSSAQFSEEKEITPEKIPLSKVERDTDGVTTVEDVARPLAVVGGKYRKVENDSGSIDCNCACIEVNFDTPTEWCIVKDKVYIKARCQKTGGNTADVYLVDVSREENQDRPLPWKDFDKDLPIASIVFQPDGTADLDWKGFNIGGKLATDYAIYGKKSLEGTYKRE